LLLSPSPRGPGSGSFGQSTHRDEGLGLHGDGQDLRGEHAAHQHDTQGGARCERRGAEQGGRGRADLDCRYMYESTPVRVKTVLF
jgi:hypothetical protein